MARKVRPLALSRHSPLSDACLQLIGLKAKLYAKKRHSEKVVLKRTLAQKSERDNKHGVDDEAPKGAVPHYLLDREQARVPFRPRAPLPVID